MTADSSNLRDTK